ncbi:molybdate ABC transporter permease subunit [Amaricoccus tamworthensis]|uniref:molybdate ABC transporter permease subunit n=1 Tax=Amaricoccus tamworthensis TaxID=57002 RepID=UPI003C7B5FB4
MDWTALWLSFRLAGLTVLVLVPLAVLAGRWLAFGSFRGRGVVEALVALPLVLPPTVFGYYLLVAFGAASPLGQVWDAVFGRSLVFTFEGLLIASLLFNIPFAVQPIQRAFEAIPRNLREAAPLSGLSPWQSFLRVELPLAWPGVLTAAVLAFAHTLGEFGIVLMVGGAIPGETRTVAISIYDSVQAFDDGAAARMAALLLAISLIAIALVFSLSRRAGRRFGGRS